MSEIIKELRGYNDTHNTNSPQLDDAYDKKKKINKNNNNNNNKKHVNVIKIQVSPFSETFIFHHTLVKL